MNSSLEVLRILVVKVLLGPALTVISGTNEERDVDLNVSQSVEDLHEFFGAHHLVDRLFRLFKVSFLVAHG